MGLLKIDPFGENKKIVEPPVVKRNVIDDNLFANVNTITLDELMAMKEADDRDDSGGLEWL